LIFLDLEEVIILLVVEEVEEGEGVEVKGHRRLVVVVVEVEVVLELELMDFAYRRSADFQAYLLGLIPFLLCFGFIIL
jgi:hypothetical protein